MPGVQLPFGTVRASPDTSAPFFLSWRHFGGYYYGDDRIRCFSHTHMVGSGTLDYGNICVMPVNNITLDIIHDYGFQSKFSHSSETIYPGYYSVFLETPHVNAQLTVTGTHTALHRYTYTSGDKIVLFDAVHSLVEGSCVDAHLKIFPENETVVGWSQSKGSLTGRNGIGIKVYFTAVFSDSIAAFGVWNQSQMFSNATEVSGNTSRAYVVLKTTNSSIEMALAISFVSIEQAKYNLKSQWSSTRFFDDYVKAARRIWAETLSQVNVTTESNESLVTFYTALYHAFMAPTQFSDSNGVYLDMENKVKRLPPGMHHYTDMSIWDIHRSQIPLLNMLRPDISSQVAQSLVRMYRDGGDLPRWPIANVYSGCMIGTHANLILLDLLSKVGSDTFDIDDAYEGMVAQATESKRPHIERSCLDEYVTLGYVPNECSSESVSLTLAYAFDDWAIATVASHLNRTNDAALFFNRSRSYRNVWNHDKKLMCPRDRHGKFHCPLDPSLNSWMIKNDGYTEGNAEQWLWFVPHDIPGLINLFGSNESFSETLEKFFSRSEDYTSNLLPNPFYWAGNEPDILAPYLFNYAGRADLTQKYTRWLADHRYTTAPSGLPGNDDYGTLSSWYIWTTLGFYPYSGTQYYAIGSPSVQSAVITLPNGILTIETHNNSKENVYVMKVVVNNRTVDLQRNPFFHHKRDIENGGHIQFWMSNNPT
ncbi:uncharacterized glycosidase Rv0584-like [Corticium candelabrum]|uniref:uncharacterized glycosidase Rv0584-like n=1 Tax=Corticium candelabrum TaxID=121492 RepID=UPI002E26961F|nr:uncharacterized glycosidase Rv0584-like [Corticium candelabrum]